MDCLGAIITSLYSFAHEIVNTEVLNFSFQIHSQNLNWSILYEVATHVKFDDFKLKLKVYIAVAKN